MLKTSQQTPHDIAGSCFVGSVEELQFSAKAVTGDIITNRFTTNANEHSDFLTTAKAVQLPIIVSQIMSSTDIHTNLGNSSCAQDSLPPEAGSKLNNCLQTQLAKDCDKETDCAISDNIVDPCQSDHAKSTVSSTETHANISMCNLTACDVADLGVEAQQSKSTVSEPTEIPSAVTDSDPDNGNTHTDLKPSTDTEQLEKSVKESIVILPNSSTDTILEPLTSANVDDNVELKNNVKNVTTSPSSEQKAEVGSGIFTESTVVSDISNDSTSDLDKMPVLTASHITVQASVPDNNSKVGKNGESAISFNLESEKLSSTSEAIPQEEMPLLEGSVDKLLSQLEAKVDSSLVNCEVNSETKTVENYQGRNDELDRDTDILSQLGGIKNTSSECSVALKMKTAKPIGQIISSDRQSDETDAADGSNSGVRQPEYGYSQDKVCVDVSVSENQNNENSVKSAERLKEKTESKETNQDNDAGNDNELLQNTDATMMDVDSENTKESSSCIVDVTCKNKPKSDSRITEGDQISETANLMTPEPVQNDTKSPAEQHEKTNCDKAPDREDTNSSVKQCDAADGSKKSVEMNSISCEDTDDEQMKLANELLENNVSPSPGEDVVTGMGEGDVGVDTTDAKAAVSEVANADSVSSDKTNNNNALQGAQKCKSEKGEVSENACDHSSSNGDKNLGLMDTSDNAKTRAFWDLGLIPSGMNKSTKDQLFLHKENGNDTTLASNTSDKKDLLVDTPRVRKAPRPFDEVYGETESTRKAVKRKRPSHPNKGPVNVSEKCLESFKLGWMRELVYRATPDESKARNADVYYYSPAKVKLRSFREIEDYLKTSKSPLTIDHFSFAKTAIYHPPEEIVREAKRTGVRQSIGTKSPASTSPLKLKLKTKKKLKRKLVKEIPKESIKESPKDSNKESQSQSESDSPKKKVPRTYELINLPSDGTNSPFRLRLKKNVKRTPFRGGVEVVPCSLNCPGQKGVLPSLHCGVCLCLYHPACVGFENNIKPFVCIKCISDRSQRNHGGQQHSKENEPTRDDYASGDAPLTLQVKAELLFDDDVASPPAKEAKSQPQDVTSPLTSPSTPLRGLPKLIQMPPTCTSSSPVISMNVNRPPPPLQKAPGVSLINKAAGATWMPPSGLPPQTKQLAPQPPPLRLANALPNMQPLFLTNNTPTVLPNRPPPPLMIRPTASLLNAEQHVPPSILSMFAVRPQKTVTVTSASKTPLRLPNPVIAGAGVTIVRPTQLVQIPAPVSAQHTPTSVTVPAGLLQQILTTVSQTASSTINTVTSTTAASASSILTVSKVNTPNVVLQPTIPATTIPANPKAVLVTMMSNPSSAPNLMPATANVNSMKFTLKTNSGMTTEVLVPQVKPPVGSGPLQPKYIVVNKQGQPTGLVVGVGNTVIQLPILNQSISVTDPNKLFKDTSTASVIHPGVQETVRTVTATSSSMVAPKPVMQSGTVVSTTLPLPVIKINTQPVPLQSKSVVQRPVVVTTSQSSVSPKVSILPVHPTTTSATSPSVELSLIKNPGTSCETKTDVTKDQKTSEALPPKRCDSGSRVNKIAKQRHPGINPSLCAMEKLMGGTKALLKIFRYLRQDDLSRASSVCRTWRWLASQTEKWKCIKLNGIQVCDWDRLVDIIKRHDSTRLDMRGMKTFEDKNRTWHGFAAALQDLSCIRRIDFGQVPVSILHTVANSLMELEVLTAEWITDIGKEADCANSNCRLDVGKFGQLVQLEKLRLRGVRGIQLPTFTLSRGLTSLSSLSKLTHLSLTTLKDVPPNDFEFLNSLNQLLALEIGDCTLWQDEHYDHLTNLSNLKMLRLECSGSDSRKGLNDALLKLKQLQHLELFGVCVDDLLLNALKELRLLLVLSLWPHESQEAATVNTAIFLGVGQLLHLQQFSWGLATENCKLLPTKSAGNSKDSTGDDDIIEIGSDDECESVESDRGSQDEEACIPFLLTEVTSEDSVYLREYLSFRELDHRLRRKLPKTKLSLHPLNSPIIHSRIHVSK